MSTDEIISDDLSYISTRVRIAVYDDMLSAPRFVDIEPAPTTDFIANIAAKTFEFSQSKGGNIPYTVINEIAENFIHAHFKECTVSILDSGNTIRFSDQGKGIEKKALVLQPGVSSATAEMKRFIKGVGSGFPIVKEYMEVKNGYITIDDNAEEGTVVTIALNPSLSTRVRDVEPARAVVQLDDRELAVLKLIAKHGELGPTAVKQLLGISMATAYRDLTKLEEKGMVEALANKKRILSDAGAAYIQSL